MSQLKGFLWGVKNSLVLSSYFDSRTVNSGTNEVSDCGTWENRVPIKYFFFLTFNLHPSEKDGVAA